MLFRNTDWSRNLLEQAAQYGRFPANMSTEVVSIPPLTVLMQSACIPHSSFSVPSFICMSVCRRIAVQDVVSMRQYGLGLRSANALLWCLSTP